MIIVITDFLSKNLFFSALSAYVKVLSYNVTDLHGCHVFNWRSIKPSCIMCQHIPIITVQNLNPYLQRP